MFSVVNGVMLRGFSFPTADRLVSLNFVDPTSTTFFGVNGQVSAMDYEELLPQQQSFELLAAYLNGSTVNVTVDGHPQRYTGAYVTEDFLRDPRRAADDGPRLHRRRQPPGAGKVAIIGYGIWQRDFGGAADIVGKGVRINGKPATIIGVMPKGFAFPTNEELWIPLFSEFPPRPRNDPAANNPAVLGLLKPGVSLDQANAEATTIAKRFAAAYPDTNKQFNTGQVQPLIETFTPRPLRGTLWTMLGFCVGVLLIACVNVMNMQFARATLRAKELAVRSSLGATRIAAGAADADREPAGRRHRRRGRHRARLLRRSTGCRHGPEPREPAARVDHVRRRRAGAAVHRVRDARGGGGLGPAAGVDVVARQRGRGAAGGRPRQHEPQRRSLISRGLVVVPDRRDLRPADRLAAAAALDHQPADDRLRLRHRRHHVGAHGPDGRRLSDAGGAQGLLRPAAAGVRRGLGVRGGRR